jgi:AraC-like DNA-binding protein
VENVGFQFRCAGPLFVFPSYGENRLQRLEINCERLVLNLFDLTQGCSLRGMLLLPHETLSGNTLVRVRSATYPGVPPAASGTLTRLAYARAEAAGINLNAILKATNMARPQIEDPSVRLMVRDQITFLNLIARELDDDLLGFHLALAPDLRETGWLYYVLASSDTMNEAIQQGVRYTSIVNEGVSLRYIHGSEVVLKVQYVGVSRHVDRQQIEAFMTLLVRTCRQLTGLPLKPERVQFMHRREAAAPELVNFFGSKVAFGADADEVVFPSTLKNKPVVSADPYLHKLLTAYCEEALSRRGARGGSFRSSVENAIAPLLPHGRAQMDEIARCLGVSRRTFARRLSSEGLTFSEVLGELRADLAKRHLADKNLSISEIAWLLGYGEVSAFTHAFKRWTGKSPREIRSHPI